MSVCACFSVDTGLLRRLDVLFFVELDTRRAYATGVTANPVESWVVQQASNLSMVLAGYQTHYNGHRPHRALDQQPRMGADKPLLIGDPEPSQLRRGGTVFGLIHEYRLVARPARMGSSAPTRFICRLCQLLSRTSSWPHGELAQPCAAPLPLWPSR
jgi:hypothetical protein